MVQEAVEASELDEGESAVIASVELRDGGAGKLVEDLVLAYGSACNLDFLECAHGLTLELPPFLVKALSEFRYKEEASAVWIRGCPVETKGMPPTPIDWRERDPWGTRELDFWLALVACQLGDPFSWESLQEGRLFNDVIPTPGAEKEQTGQGSRAELMLHVEDAFEELRCDYVALLCLRNEELVPTMLATVDSGELSRETLNVLFEPRFRIHPDPTHVRGARLSGDEVSQTASVLFGSRVRPYLRFDPAYTECLSLDKKGEKALEALCAHLEERVVDVRLRAGDMLLVDNLRAVHGRRPFEARYDGSDRWLRKLTVTRDLRRSRERRVGSDGRIIALR